MNLSDAEIIKALDEHSRRNGNKYVREVCKNALDLINRLKAENKNCGVKIQNQREQLKATNEKIKELSNELREAREDAEKSKQIVKRLSAKMVNLVIPRKI